MPEKIWNYRHRELKPENVRRISKNLNIPPVITAILLNRNVSETDIPAFMAKSMKSVRNPMLMKDMDKAVKRIKTALDKHEKIVVYGDYDVDGITSTTLMYDFLASLGADVDFYIPNRENEGYGMNIKAVNRLIKQGVKLLITVDCGITALGEVSFAKLLGMDVIVTDHHTCTERLPEDACAVLNPKRPDCDYPFDGLAGVGVAFKLVLALAMLFKMNTTQCFNKYIDIVALGTIADIVPLLDENRIMTAKGVAAIASSSRPGIRALIKVSEADKRPFNATSVAFTLAPRLNAAGRLGSADAGVKLLLEKDYAAAEKMAQQLEEENRRRRSEEQIIYAQALEMLEADSELEKKKVIVLAKSGWHKGVIGIAAARICERFYKPCILLSIDERGVGKGSGRSVQAFNLFNALAHCEDLLTAFGGHSAAAGLTIDEKSIEEFTKKINAYADSVLTAADMIPKLDIDYPVTEKDISVEAAKLLEGLEPFGAGNEKPVFALENARVYAADTMGADGRHLRLRILTGDKIINCAGFSMGELAKELNAGDNVSIAFNMDINRFRGAENVQLIIKDIKKGGRADG